MNDFFFGLGNGSVSAREAARIRKAIKSTGESASFVQYCEPGCRCGYGCRGSCKACQRYWFATGNYGEPHNSRVARAVMAAVGEIKTK